MHAQPEGQDKLRDVQHDRKAEAQVMLVCQTNRARLEGKHQGGPVKCNANSKGLWQNPRERPAKVGRGEKLPLKPNLDDEAT